MSLPESRPAVAEERIVKKTESQEGTAAYDAGKVNMSVKGPPERAVSSAAFGLLFTRPSAHGQV